MSPFTRFTSFTPTFHLYGAPCSATNVLTNVTSLRSTRLSLRQRTRVIDMPHKIRKRAYYDFLHHRWKFTRCEFNFAYSTYLMCECMCIFNPHLAQKHSKIKHGLMSKSNQHLPTDYQFIKVCFSPSSRTHTTRWRGGGLNTTPQFSLLFEGAVAGWGWLLLFLAL